MSYHERTLTPRALTFSELSITNDLFRRYCENRSLELFSLVAKSCISELSEKYTQQYILPKELSANLLTILGDIKINATLEYYIPCLNLLQFLLSSTTFPVSPALVHQLCLFLTDIKNHEITQVLINSTFAMIDTLYHLALSRRKKSEHMDSIWIQKISLCFTGLLNELLSKPELEELAMAQYNPSQERISLDSRIIKNNIYTDLVLYLSIAIIQLTKLLTNTVPHDFFSNTMPALF